ncbi:MAG: O-antigen chain length determinant protein, WzzB/FepE family [Rhodocyclaceae bacterium]|nr:O-antigen chain length determinant protein, WzzB/FepE family [Rhodocyclaceae bacterium]
MNSPSFPPSPDIQTLAATDNEIDLIELWRTLVEFKWTIVVTTLLCLATAATIAFMMTPVYQADVLVAPAEEGKGNSGLAALAGQLGGIAELAGVNASSGGSNKETAIAYLKSRIFIENFIKEKNLLPVLYPNQWDITRNDWAVEDKSKIPTLWDAHQLFSKKVLSVTSDKKTGLITITIEWKNREQAVEWANEIVKRANDHLRQKAIAETELSVNYLESELKKTSVVEVQQAIFKVMESQIKSKMMANVQEQFAFIVIDPAALMNENAYIRPKRQLITVLGLLVGVMMGTLIAFIRSTILKHRAFA